MTDKWVALSVRKLKQGSWDEFRSAWDPREHGGDFAPFLERIMHVQSVDDPNLVISFGIAGASEQEAREYFDTPERRAVEERRQAAVKPLVEETLVDGVFRVTEEIVPAAV